ncbi:hypothetical protein ACA910_022536 [Epithemia clementina (nom. ined.)]
MDNTIVGMDFGDDDHPDADPAYDNNTEISSSDESLHYDTEEQPDSEDEMNHDGQVEYDDDQGIPLHETDNDVQESDAKLYDNGAD